MLKIKETSNKFLIIHSAKENLRRKCYYFLCLFSCFLVALVSLISKTILSQGPIIFLMLAEQNTGEIDIIIKTNPLRAIPFLHNSTEDFRINYAFINRTNLNEIMNKNKKFEGNISSHSAGRIAVGGLIGREQYRESVYVEFYVIDSQKEREAELGRSYPLGTLDPNECVIHKSIADMLKLPDLDGPSGFSGTIFLQINMEFILTNMLLDTYGTNGTHRYNPNIKKILSIPTIVNLPCKVKYYLEQNYGKFSQEEHQITLMEKKSFFRYISKFLPKDLITKFPGFDEILSKLDPDQYINTLIVNFPKPRIDSYLVSNLEDVQYKGISYTNELTKAFGGLDHIVIDLPVIRQMQPLYYGSIFLGMILNFIILILFVLSLILINSLLLITMETSSFELGILRLLGVTRLGIIKLIILQCLSFSILASILAYLSHFFVLDLISSVLSKYTDNGTSLRQNTYSIIFSVVISNLAPLIAAIFPIRSLLSQNLAFALNTTTNKTSGVKIEIMSASENEQRIIVTFGMLTFLYGISIYYFLPLSLLALNLSLLLFIFIWILVGMLLGFIILALNLESIVQKIFVYVAFFWTKSYTKLMILKNLTAHRIRNRKTSLMYSLSVGFFIMISVSLNIELKSINILKLAGKGVYAVLTPGEQSYPRPEILAQTMDLMLTSGAIIDYTYLSAKFELACNQDTDISIGNIGKSMDFSIGMFAISSNFYEVGERIFLKIDEKSMIKMPLAEKLYAQENDGKIGMSGIFTWEIDLHLNDTFYLIINSENNEMRHIFKSSYILHASPSIEMRAEPSMRLSRNAVLPIHLYLDLVNKCRLYFTKRISDLVSYSYDDYPIGTIMLKLNPKISSDQAAIIIKKIVDDDKNYYLRTWFYSDEEGQINKIQAICELIFSGVSVFVLIFCFFNLAASMTINIYEQKKEIAIMRSLGMTANHIIFIYISESFVLIFCASFMGMIVGGIMSWTITLQRILFTNMPLTFDIPYIELVSIFVSSIFAGFLSTIIPAYVMLKKPISNLIRSG